MTDREFLMWIHERLANVYGESESIGYMHRLRAIISATPAGRDTPNDGRGCYDLALLRERMRRLEMDAI
jgi:hypothetical protein